MSEHYGFFNALNVNGNYDRKYNANDYTDNLAVVINNGVLRSINDDLKVSATGMIISVAPGRAWINGHYYKNDAALSFPATTAPTGGKRYDRIMLRLNTAISARNVSLVYVTGTAAATPIKPVPTRSNDVYDLVLADIYVDTNATSLTVTDTRADKDICGWVYSTSGDNSFFTSLDNSFEDWFDDKKDTLASVTLFKRYTWRTVLTAASSTVQFSISQYNADTCFLEVYVNGVLEAETVNYTINTSNNVITFTGTLIAGTEVIVKCYKSIDGTGIESVSDEITALQNTVNKLDYVANYAYYCTNNNDNISLSQIAQALYSGSYVTENVTTAAAAFLEKLGGNTGLSALPTDAHITIDVYGKCGVSTPFSGDGSSTNKYKWFSLGVEATSDKRVTFDFAHCERMQILCSTNTENLIVFGTDLDIRNLNLQAKCNNTSCSIQMFGSRYNYGKINVENSNIYISTTGKAQFAQNGTFINCDVCVSSSGTYAFCFVPETDSLIRIIGGTYRAYTASTANDIISAVFYTYSTTATGVISAYNINCPTVAVSSFYQKYLSAAYGGKTYINGVISTLSSTGNYNEITGQLQYSKRY